MKHKKNNFEDMVKALKISSRNDAFNRNGGGQFVAITRPHKNHKKYNRKRDKKNFDFDLSLFLFNYNQFHHHP